MTANICTTNSGRLFVTYRISKHQYMLYTRSFQCVFPHKLLPGRRERTGYNLYHSNATVTPT